MKRYHIYLTGTKYLGSVTPQLMAQCIRDFDKFDYPYMANLLRDLCADAKLRADPTYPQNQRVVVNEVKAMLWGTSIGATKATRKAFDCTRDQQRHGLFLSFGEEPLPCPASVGCLHCGRPY